MQISCFFWPHVFLALALAPWVFSRIVFPHCTHVAASVSLLALAADVFSAFALVYVLGFCPARMGSEVVCRPRQEKLVVAGAGKRSWGRPQKKTSLSYVLQHTTFFVDSLWAVVVLTYMCLRGLYFWLLPPGPSMFFWRLPRGVWILGSLISYIHFIFGRI